MLFWIFFTIHVGGIGAYFVYFHWNLKKKDVARVEFGTCTQTTFIKVKQINTKNRTYYFYNDQINLKDFDARLLKVDKKITTRLTLHRVM